MFQRTTLASGGRFVVALLLLLWAGEVPTARPAAQDVETSVLGAKVTRCTADDGALVVTPGIHRLTAENAPLTVRVAGGRITSILTKPLKITPGTTPIPRLASFTIGAPSATGGSLAFTVSMANLTDCSARMSLAHGVARRGSDPSRVSGVRFGDVDRVEVAPGEKVAGRFSVPLAGDGVYEISASVYTEVGLVR